MHEPGAPPAAAGIVPPPAQAKTARRDRSGQLTALALLLILALAAYLRFTHINWDATSGPWDPQQSSANSGHLHPDERFLTQISTNTRGASSIANYFDTDTSGLSPYNIKNADGSRQSTFVYGTLPLFMNKFLALHANTPYDVLDTVTFGNADAVNTVIGALMLDKLALPDHNYADYDGYNLSGRWLSALFDVGTVLLIFAFGAQLANRRVGLLAAFLYALSAFPIQNAHFFVVDPYVTFFATFTVLFAVRSAKRGGWRNFAAAGLGAGLAAGCKITAISLFPVVLLGVGVYAWGGIKPYVAPMWAGDTPEYAVARDGRRLDSSIATLIIGSAIALLAGFLAFRVAMPYAFKTPSLGDWLSLRAGHVGPLPFPYPDIMNRHWLTDQTAQRQLLGGDAAFPPNVQWIGRSRWLWPAQQMISWGMAPALGITAWLGVPFAAWYARRNRDGALLVPLAWVLGYFGFMGMQFSLYMRYFLPLYPTLTVFGAFLLYQAWRWAASERPLAALGSVADRVPALTLAARNLVRAGVVVVAVFTAIFGIAFYRIYTHPVTRVSASKWVLENVPEGSTIGHEDWDDSVPYGVGNVPNRQYSGVQFKNFDQDTPETANRLIDYIGQSDYIALASARVSGTITRAPALWPVASRYYAALEDGTLGFEKVAEFAQYPSIFGHDFNDTGAEESYSVYDHPTVTIYKKTSAYSPAKARQVLHADAFPQFPSILPGDAGQNGLMFKPDVLKTQQAGGTFSDLYDATDFVNAHPVFFWLLVMELAAFSLLPLTLALFRGLPDRGFLLTKPLGILLLAYLAYAPASRGTLQYTRTEIASMLGVMLAVGVLTAALWRRDIVAFVRERWRFLLFAEAVFLLMFALSYWLRLQNPDLFHPSQGGEKPMDFAYLQGVAKSTDLSQGPIDPWNAGGYLNYYWFGQFIGATVMKLTGIVPEVSYNLIVPMFFAITAAATFSLAYNLTEATRRLMKRRPSGLPIGPAGPIVAALAAIFLVLLSGNFAAVQVLEQGFSRVSPWHSGVPVLGGIVAIAGGFKAAIVGDAGFRRMVYDYDWWAPSRALGIIPTAKDNVTPITEFPFWTFLFADLHAHLMAIPFSMTAAAVGLGAVLNVSRLNPAGAAREHGREVRSWALVVLLGLIVGALRWINSWDYPPFLLLGAAALIIAERGKEGRVTLRAISTGVIKAAVMGVASYAFFQPFAKNYSQAYTGFHQSDQTTALGDYFKHFGIMLFMIAGFVLFSLNRAMTRTSTVRAIFFGRGRRRRPIETTPVLIALLVAGGLAIWAATLHRWGVTVFAAVGLVAVILAAIRELRAPTPVAPVLLFVYAMIALGLGLCGGVEVLTLDGDIGRMNTVFKFYEHVWMLWGVAASFSAWYLFAVMRPHDAFMRRAGELNAALVRVPRYAFAIIVAVLLVASLVFPYFGTRARLHSRFDPAQPASNDGLAYLDSSVVYNNIDPSTGHGGVHNMADTRDLINWIRKNIPGSPTVMEAVGPSYRSLGNRVAINTGLPAVTGYGYHQSQQRAKFSVMVEQRQRDVARFYSTTDVGEARLLLLKYDVEWVIVGDEERLNYPAEGLKKFTDGLGGVLEKVYENPSNQIWHVIPQDQLQASATAH